MSFPTPRDSPTPASRQPSIDRSLTDGGLRISIPETDVTEPGKPKAKPWKRWRSLAAFAQLVERPAVPVFASVARVESSAHR